MPICRVVFNDRTRLARRSSTSVRLGPSFSITMQCCLLNSPNPETNPEFIILGKPLRPLTISSIVDSLIPNCGQEFLKINSHNLQILRSLGTMFADRVHSRSLRNLLEQKSVQCGNSVLKFKLLCLHGVLR